MFPYKAKAKTAPIARALPAMLKLNPRAAPELLVLLGLLALRVLLAEVKVELVEVLLLRAVAAVCEADDVEDSVTLGSLLSSEFPMEI